MEMWYWLLLLTIVQLREKKKNAPCLFVGSFSFRNTRGKKIICHLISDHIFFAISCFLICVLTLPPTKAMETF